MKTISFISSSVMVFLFLNCGSNEVGSEKINDVTPYQNDNLKPSKFKINIDRKIKGANCTQGYILVNGVVIAYTLELPDVINKDYISSIPKGVYSAFIRTDGRKGWRIELDNVPQRENIQIHVGNYTSQIEGCILIGTKVDLDNCAVLNDFKREAIDTLQKMFNKFTTDLVLGQGTANPIEIEVEISGI